jgi:hypothetical protein
LSRCSFRLRQCGESESYRSTLLYGTERIAGDDLNLRRSHRHMQVMSFAGLTDFQQAIRKY